MLNNDEAKNELEEIKEIAKMLTEKTQSTKQMNIHIVSNNKNF